MKILVVCSTLELKYKLGSTPSWWQLLKALYEIGNEVIVVPYLGDPVESLWWRTYPNPCSWESKIYNRYLERKKKKRVLSQYNARKDSFLKETAIKRIRNKWENYLKSILKKEKNTDMLLFLGSIPLNHIAGITSKIKKDYQISIAYYDGDLPTILPKYAIERGFKFNCYVNADLSEFDAFFTNSKGVIPDLKELGARNIHPLYYGADPDLFNPVHMKKDIEVSFFGYGNTLREEWMTNMITKPSLIMEKSQFSIAGGDFSMNLGNAKNIGDLSFSDYRKFCCRSKICLNIMRSSHTSVYASSSARPFELAAYGACIVSQPYNGIEEWFEVGKEIIIANNENEVFSIYQYLLDSDDEREKIGKLARQRILKEHTYRHRAEELIHALDGRKSRTGECDESFKEKIIIDE